MDAAKSMTKSNITIRRATTKDIETLLAYRVEMFRSEREHSEASLTTMQENLRPVFQEWLSSERFIGWIAENERHEPVACGGIMIFDFPSSPRNQNFTRAEILNVYTIPEYRRQGIARKLMDEMINWCKHAGYASVGLHATTMGRPLYESMGFEPTSGMVLWIKE